MVGKQLETAVAYFEGGAGQLVKEGKQLGSAGESFEDDVGMTVLEGEVGRRQESLLLCGAV